MVANSEELLAACTPALADLDRSRPGLLRLGDAPDLPPGMNPWGNQVPQVWLWDTDGGDGTGIWLGEPGERVAAAVSRMTEVVQDAAIEAVHGAWPECPDHPDSHPLEAVPADDVTVWSCPISGRVIAPVGELR